MSYRNDPNGSRPASDVRAAGADAGPIGFPRLNEPAPYFEAKTTHGTRRLTDYKGKYLVLFSHPADFTPVCTTEFIGFAKHHDEFSALDTELLGLSIDSNFAHLAWLRNMEEKLGVAIPFPVIEDLSMRVAHAYGMIHPASSETSAVRAVFVIDREGILRAMIYYPKDNGRSIPEIVRLVRALQTTDEHQVATPEGWTPGDRVIVPPPATLEEASNRIAMAAEGELECIDWYLCKKDLPESAPRSAELQEA
ncbi:MAG: peroxiredoxin [Gemmatimonadota bacterium]|nr:peroxiredoxin [Gemmatimonadota bacterium]